MYIRGLLSFSKRKQNEAVRAPVNQLTVIHVTRIQFCPCALLIFCKSSTTMVDTTMKLSDSIHIVLFCSHQSAPQLLNIHQSGINTGALYIWKKGKALQHNKWNYETMMIHNICTASIACPVKSTVLVRFVCGSWIQRCFSIELHWWTNRVVTVCCISRRLKCCEHTARGRRCHMRPACQIRARANERPITSELQLALTTARLVTTSPFHRLASLAGLLIWSWTLHPFLPGFKILGLKRLHVSCNNCLPYCSVLQDWGTCTEHPLPATIYKSSKLLHAK